MLSKKEAWRRDDGVVAELSHALHEITQHKPLVDHTQTAKAFLYDGYDEENPMDLPLLSIAVQTSPDYFYWDILTVADHLQGRGLGLLSVKCVLSLASMRGVSQIKVDLLSREGYGFWPTLGAEPQAPLTSAFKKVIKAEAMKIAEPQTRKALLSFVPKAEVSPLGAWRALSQTSNINAAFCDAKKSIFRDGSKGDGVVIDINNPHTASVLEKRMGILPPPARGAAL